jgi:hypothetical protein
MTDEETNTASAVIEERLSAVRAEKAERDRLADEVAKAEEGRVSVLDAAKAECFAACGPIAEALSKTTDPAERQALVGLENETHAAHAEKLAAAHFAFSGQTREESNPAIGPTDIDAAIVVESGVSAS